MFHQNTIRAMMLSLILVVMTAAGTYFLMPAPRQAQAESCDDDRIIKRILYCLQGAEISHGKFYPYCTW
jgi:hypothetical protein